MSKLLNIAIPTYNRKQACLTTVTNFVKQVIDNNLQNDVEITVSDNCSPDETYEELVKLQEKYTDFLKVSQQATNVGYLKNFLTLLNNCDCEYFWQCGDDDIYAENIVPTIIDILKNHENLIYVFINPDYGNDNIGVKIEEDFYGKFPEVMDIVRQNPTFISTNIVKTDEYRNLEYDDEIWPAYEKLCRMDSDKNAYIIAKPMIINQKADMASDWQSNPDRSLLYINKLLHFYLKEKENVALANTRDFLIKFYMNMTNDIGKYTPQDSVSQEYNKKYKKYKRLFNLFLVLFILAVVMNIITAWILILKWT